MGRTLDGRERGRFGGGVRSSGRKTSACSFLWSYGDVYDLFFTKCYGRATAETRGSELALLDIEGGFLP